MDAKLFTQMLRDKNLIDLKKMQYKYSKDAVAELLDLLKDSVFLSLPLLDVHAFRCDSGDAASHFVHFPSTGILLVILVCNMATSG